ncbi:MAG: hypothetical protein ACK4MT_04860 [Thermaurantiacus tibetensis]|uniref:hypothetical protein n=1 Tax=Thermaurantiacus tibetensis TaxID=2759035 RepID=UPI00188DEA5A|nr:hypothetical protein [Thermaurantiacus tibetensis]
MSDPEFDTHALVDCCRGCPEARTVTLHLGSMKLLDAIIPATAQVRGASLITRDTRDLPAGWPGIRVPSELP